MSITEDSVLTPKSRIPTISQKSSFVSPENLENPLQEDPQDLRPNPEQFFSPRIKASKKSKTPATYIIDEEFPSPAKKGDFNQFLTKIEVFQKTKNDKIVCMQALKKQKEELELKSIPKVRMSNKSKKILEEKKKRKEEVLETSNLLSSVPKVKSDKVFSYSSRKIGSKAKMETVCSLETVKVQRGVKETPSQFRSEKVLASKFLKDYTKTFDEISKGKTVISEEETRVLMKSLLFMSNDSENSVKVEIEEKLFGKMWKITGAEENQSISIDSLKNFLLGVMNFFLPSMAHNQPGVQFGRVILNKYHLSQEEALKVHKVFLPFYENRVNGMKKFTHTQKIERFVENFKSLKGEKNSVGKVFAQKGRSEKPVERRENAFGDKLEARGTEKSLGRSTCITPGPKKNKLNTSFRSARSKSRSKSRGKVSGRSSISEIEWVGVNHDQISDPSIIMKAQSILGAFAVKKSEEVTKKPGKSVERENNKKVTTLGKSTSQKLIFNKKNHVLKTVAAKPIDEGLKKIRELLNERKGSDDVVLDVNLPDGLQKTLIIPRGRNQKQAIQKFAADHNLSLEMAKALLNSIKSS